MRICLLLHKSVVHDSRVRRTGRTLAAAGNEVTVLELADVGRHDQLDGFTRRSVLPPEWLPAPLYRAAFAAAFVLGIARARPDVVHANDAAMLLPGLLGARLIGARVVYDTHELATGVPYRAGWRARLVGLVERVGIRRAAVVITVSDGIADRLQRLYGLRRRPHVVRNVPDVPADGGAPMLRARLGIGDAPLVLHQGALMAGRGCETLVRAFARIGEGHLVFLGDGEPATVAAVREVADQLGVGHVVHHVPSVPVDELVRETSSADVGVSLLEDSCDNHRLTLPNKLFDYIAAGVPVVASDLPGVGGVVRERGVGWTVRSDDPDDIARGLGEALAARGDEALRARLAEASRELRWEHERRRLLDAYRALSAA